MQLVAELKEAQQQRHQQQISDASQRSGERSAQQASSIAHADTTAVQSRSSPRTVEPNHQPDDQPHVHHQQQRLSDTGQFVVETSSDTAGSADHEPTTHVSHKHLAEAAGEEVSFSDDEDGNEDAVHADTAVQQALTIRAAVPVIEQSVVVEEEVEEEVF